MGREAHNAMKIQARTGRFVPGVYYLSFHALLLFFLLPSFFHDQLEERESVVSSNTTRPFTSTFAPYSRAYAKDEIPESFESLLRARSSLDAPFCSRTLAIIAECDEFLSVEEDCLFPLSFFFFFFLRAMSWSFVELSRPNILFPAICVNVDINVASFDF